MAKRKRSPAQIERTECMSTEIPIQREKLMRKLHKTTLIQEQHREAFTKSSDVCTR